MKVSQMPRKNDKKHVSAPDRFHVSYKGAKNMERCRNNGIALMLWKHVILFQHFCVQKATTGK